MSDHSNGVFAALNMIQEWEYTRNHTFLRGVAFPFAREALKFYQGWMHRRAGGTWANENDQANECNPPGIITAWKVFEYCWQNNTVDSNGFVRRVARALPSMARAIGEAVDLQWEEIASGLDPLPTVLTRGTKTCPFDPPRRVVVLAGNYTAAAAPAAAPAAMPAGAMPADATLGATLEATPPATSTATLGTSIRSGRGPGSNSAAVGGCNDVQCGTRRCGASSTCRAQVAGDGMMDVMAWPV